MKASIADKIWYALLIVILLLAIGERVSIYLDARALMIDEANLAFNFVDRSYTGLFAPLDHAQYAPPIFAVAQKLLISAWGIHEYALRLLPLLAGIGSLVLLICIAKRFMSLPLVIYTLALIGFSWYFLRYGTEVKQYSTDVFLVLLFCYWSLRWPLDQMTTLRWLALALGGAAAIWASMPMVFMLAAIGAYYAHFILQQKANRALLPLMVTSVLWIGSFGWYYVTILSHDIGSEYLQSYHDPFFFNPIITGTADARAQYYIFQNLLATAFPKWLPLLLLNTLAIVVGWIHLWRQKQAVFHLLFWPVVLPVIASMLHLFTLIPRVSLFLVPLLVITAGIGFYYLWQKLAAPWRWGVPIVIVLSLYFQSNFSFLYRPMHIDPIKKAIQHIQSSPMDSVPVIVYYEAVPAFKFYTQYYHWKERYQLPECILTDWEAFDPVFSAYQSGSTPFWVLMTHLPQKDVHQWLPDNYYPADSFQLERAYSFLFTPGI